MGNRRKQGAGLEEGTQLLANYDNYRDSETMRLMRLLETTRLMETYHGDSEVNKRLPLYDFRFFPDFLGSVLPSVYCH